MGGQKVQSHFVKCLIRDVFKLLPAICTKLSCMIINLKLACYSICGSLFMIVVNKLIGVHPGQITECIFQIQRTMRITCIMKEMTGITVYRVLFWY